MAAELRIPITNSVTGNDYTMALSLGSEKTALNVLLDTGAGLLVVDGEGYDASTDRTARTTQLLQTASFGTGSFTAAVVQTSIGLPVADPAGPVVLQNGNLAVTYQTNLGPFGKADGILGLAYSALDTAYRMPADSFKTRYKADQVRLGQPVNLDPFISQLATAGLAPEIFAFAVSRSMPSQALDDPDTDPLNNGLLILGGGPACTDLYSGAFTKIAVVHERYYHTNLLSVQVGGQTITVPPPAPGGLAFSTAIIDSGASVLQLDQGVYARTLAAFAAVNPGFPEALQARAGCDQTTLNLAEWPPLVFVFQGSDGKPTSIAIAPQDYWQFDCGRKGLAVATIAGDNGALAGQSILGLPIFTGHFVVFDRTGGPGHGGIGFAARARPLTV